MSAQQHGQPGNQIQPQTRDGLVLPPGSVSPHNFTGDPRSGKFVDWDAHYGQPIAKEDSLAKAEWASPSNPADAHFGGSQWGRGAPMAGKYDDRQPDGTGTNNGRPYQEGITGEDPFEGSNAARVEQGRMPSAPAETIAPAGKMTSIADMPRLPFADQLAGFYGERAMPQDTQAPRAAAPAAAPHAPAASGQRPPAAPQPPAAKMGHDWPDMEAGLAALMEDAEHTIHAYMSGEQDERDAMAGKASRFDKLASSLAHRKHPPSDPKAVAAAIGRKKYGAKGMGQLAAHGKMTDADQRVAEVRDRFSFRGETGAGAETTQPPAGKRPRAVQPAEKSFDASTELDALVKSLEPLAKSLGHKFVSKKPSGHGGFDYKYPPQQGAAPGPAPVENADAVHSGKAARATQLATGNPTESAHLKAARAHGEAAMLVKDRGVGAQHEQQQKHHAHEADRIRRARHTEANAAADRGDHTEAKRLRGATDYKTEKSMQSEITDTAGRPLKKGLFAFNLRALGGQQGSEVPEEYLFDYLCSFVECAYEEESGEVQHSKLDPRDQLATMAQSCMHALVQMLPQNPNLGRACKKFKVTKEVIAKILVEQGFYKPEQDSEFTDDGNGAMGAHQLAQSDFAYSHPVTPFLAEDHFRVPGLTLRGPVEQAPDEGMLKSEDSVDPHMLVAAEHQRAARSQWGEGYSRAGDGPASPIGDCPIHNGRDIHKAQQLDHGLLKCTCG